MQFIHVFRKVDIQLTAFTVQVPRQRGVMAYVVIVLVDEGATLGSHRRGGDTR